MNLGGGDFLGAAAVRIFEARDWQVAMLQCRLHVVYAGGTVIETRRNGGTTAGKKKSRRTTRSNQPELTGPEQFSQLVVNTLQLAAARADLDHELMSSQSLS